jgi:serine phosphatase RsbU (regulator of sigma subunit)
VWNEGLLDIPVYAFDACNRGGPRASHAIGCAELSEDTLALWAIRMHDSDGRSKLSNELETALVRQSPALILSSLNDAMCQAHPDTSSLAEICVMVLDTSAHTLRTAAAGDFLPELRTQADDVFQLDRTRNDPPLGLIPSVEYDTKLIEFAPGPP